MRNKDVVSTKYLLIGLLLMIVLAGLTACTEGSSSTGAMAAAPPAPEGIQKARARLQEHYPEAAAYPTVLSERWAHTYGVYYDGMIYLTKLWQTKNAREPVWGACLIVHEWIHSLGIGHGPEMDRRVRECRNTI